MDTSPSRWLAHTAMSDPGEYGSLVAGLPRDLASLALVVQGLLVHCDCLAMDGLDAATMEPFSRSTLPVRERLERRLARGGFDLGSRVPARRGVGTCRDFALLFTSILRTNGIPARCRCGFGSYLGPGWGDHWVCEYWDVDEAVWRLADAQLGPMQISAWGIAFDPLDLPRAAFLPANEAWAACRSGQMSADLFGHGETRGPWFMAVNVARDCLSLDGHVISPWDTWRQATGDQRKLTQDDVLAFDAIARDPELTSCPITPPWLLSGLTMGQVI